jgi:hypothetical protein
MEDYKRHEIYRALVLTIDHDLPSVEKLLLDTIRPYPQAEAAVYVETYSGGFPKVDLISGLNLPKPEFEHQGLDGIVRLQIIPYLKGMREMNPGLTLTAAKAVADRLRPGLEAIYRNPQVVAAIT